MRHSNLKHLASFLFYLLIFFSSKAQDQNSTVPAGVTDPTSKINYFEIEDSRINFYVVDDNYNVINGNIYFITKSGFRINLGWDSVKVGNDYYMILTYPKFVLGSTGQVTGQNTPSYYALELAKITAANAVLPDSLKIDATKTFSAEDIQEANDKLPDNLKIVLPAQDAAVTPLASFDASTTVAWKRMPLAGTDSLKLCIKKSDFDKLNKVPIYATGLKHIAFSSGQLTVPFKLRWATGGKNFSMTTDVTIGAYGGIKFRVSKKQPYFLTIPVVVGLTFINVNDNTTTTTSPSTTTTASGVHPGWTISTGLIAQLGSFNLGLITGWDFSSDVGNTWIYQGKNWISFGLGYSFLK